MKSNNTVRGGSTLKMQLIRLSVLVLALITLSSASGCTGSVPREFTDNKELWESKDLRDYDFTLERQCFCPEDWRGPVDIQVRNGSAVSMTYVSDGTDVDEEKFGDVDTIDKLFVLLEDAYSGTGEFEEAADSITAEYDSEMGYPLNMYIDESQMIADEEQGYTVTNLTAR